MTNDPSHEPVNVVFVVHDANHVLLVHIVQIGRVQIQIACAVGPMLRTPRYVRPEDVGQEAVDSPVQGLAERPHHTREQLQKVHDEPAAQENVQEDELNRKGALE